MSKSRFLISLVATLALVGAGCANQGTNQNSSAETKVKIGVMVPLTGEASAYGESVKKAVELSLKDSQVTNIELVYQDSKCDGKEAVSAMNALVSEKVIAVIGELCSGASLAAAPIAEQNKVVMVSPASTAVSFSDAGDYIFRVIPNDAGQGVFGAQLVAQKGYKRLAILNSNEDYGNGFEKILDEEFPKTGGTIVASETFDKGATDVRAQITKVKAAKPDAIFLISNSPDSSAAVLKQLKEQKVDAVVFASEGLKNPDIVTGAKGAAEGVLITSVSAGTDNFVAAHKVAYNAEPGPFAAQGYDAMAVIARAVKAGATTSDAIREKIMADEFEGVSGKIKFDAKGDVGGNYVVFVVRDDAFMLVK